MNQITAAVVFGILALCALGMPSVLPVWPGQHLGSYLAAGWSFLAFCAVLVLIEARRELKDRP